MLKIKYKCNIHFLSPKYRLFYLFILYLVLQFFFFFIGMKIFKNIINDAFQESLPKLLISPPQALAAKKTAVSHKKRRI